MTWDLKYTKNGVCVQKIAAVDARTLTSEHSNEIFTVQARWPGGFTENIYGSVLSKIKHARVRERVHNEPGQTHTLHFNEVATEIEPKTTYQSQTCQSSSVLLTCAQAQNICFN